jgi:hypothetical protein
VLGIDCGDHASEWVSKALQRPGCRLIQQNDDYTRTSKLTDHQTGDLDFIRPSLDRMYYGIASSVCLSVCLSGPCRQDRDRTVSSRIIQLGILDYHHERKNPMVFQGQRSKVKVIALIRRKTL